MMDFILNMGGEQNWPRIVSRLNLWVLVPKS